MGRNDTPHNRVPRFVVSGKSLIIFTHHHGLALGAHHDLVLGPLHLGHLHHALVGAGSEQRRLIDQVGEIGTRETRRTACDQCRLHIIRGGYLAQVYFKNLFPSAYIGKRHNHLAVETTRAQQCGIQHIGTVGRGNNDHTLVAFKPVHLHQQLIECLLSLIVSTTKTGAAVATDRVDLVNKDDTGGRVSSPARTCRAHGRHLHQRTSQQNRNRIW